MTNPTQAAASGLQRELEAGRFVLTEVSPPVSTDPAEFIAKALPLRGLATTKMNAELGVILKQPDVGEHFLKFGAEGGGGTPEQFANFIRAEQVKWGKVIREAKIRIDGQAHQGCRELRTFHFSDVHTMRERRLSCC